VAAFRSTRNRLQSGPHLGANQRTRGVGEEASALFTCTGLRSSRKASRASLEAWRAGHLVVWDPDLLNNNDSHEPMSVKPAESTMLGGRWVYEADGARTAGTSGNFSPGGLPRRFRALCQFAPSFS